MRATPPLPLRLWRIAAGSGAAIHAAAMAADLVVRRLEPTHGGTDRDEEQLMLVREIEACDVRLRLLPPFDSNERDQSFRRDLQRRRDDAAARLMRAKDTTG
jgi:hypothetical protein